MRDLGTLVWVVLVFVGVVSSMISTIRKQAQARSPGRPPPPRAAAPQPIPPPPVPPPKPPPARPQPVPPLHPGEEPRAKRAPLFAGKGQLVRAVIGAEVLGKPRGLRDEHFVR
ncbi:MAG TPA: hypothetical protein VIW73_12560 [Candidatus Cybelea sp.]